MRQGLKTAYMFQEMNANMLNFRYADVGKSGGRTYIYYYVMDPHSGKLVRFREYISREYEKNKKHAQQLIKQINKQLEEGWNPFINKKGEKFYTPILEAIDFFLILKQKSLRPESIRTYRSLTGLLKDWINEKTNFKMICQFNAGAAQDYLNYLLLERNPGARTYNNYIAMYRTMFNELERRQYVPVNPFKDISHLKEQEKTKKPFTKEQLELYRDYLLTHDYAFFIVSGYIYYCAIRPAEVRRLQIKHFDLISGFVNTPPHVSKNGKNKNINIPSPFLERLKSWFEGYSPEYYICSKDFKPGPAIMKAKTFTSHFPKVRKALKLPADIYLYSLKDTAAGRLIGAGFDIRTLRDHFRHTNISITDAYIAGRNLQKNDKIRDNYPEF
jgi:integrase